MSLSDYVPSFVKEQVHDYSNNLKNPLLTLALFAQGSAAHFQFKTIDYFLAGDETLALLTVTSEAVLLALSLPAMYVYLDTEISYHKLTQSHLEVQTA